MRRSIFYLSVALFAFGIGSFDVFNFYWKSTEQSVTAQATEIDTVSKLEIKNDRIQTELVSSFLIDVYKTFRNLL